MTGELPKVENSAIVGQPAPRGAVEFGVDLSQRQPTFHPKSGGENVFRVRDADSPTTLRNEGPISAITMPPGWNELIPSSTPGVNVFRVKDGTTYVPRDHPVNPKVQIHLGPGAQDRVSPQGEAAFRQLLSDKPALNGPQQLTPQEFQSVAGTIRGMNGGNDYAPVYVTEAATININGRTGLLVKGEAPGVIQQALYFDNPSGQGPGSIEQLSMSTPVGRFQQYDRAFWFSANSIRW